MPPRRARPTRRSPRSSRWPRDGVSSLRTGRIKHASALLQGYLRHADQGIKVYKDHKHDIVYSVYILNTVTKVATVPYSQLHPDGGDLMPTTEFFNVREAAKRLNIHENPVRNLAKRGKLQ